MAEAVRIQARAADVDLGIVEGDGVTCPSTSRLTIPAQLSQASSETPSTTPTPSLECFRDWTNCISATRSALSGRDGTPIGLSRLRFPESALQRSSCARGHPIPGTHAPHLHVVRPIYAAVYRDRDVSRASAVAQDHPFSDRRGGHLTRARPVPRPLPLGGIPPVTTERSSAELIAR